MSSQFGSVLRRLRTRAGMTQQELEALSEVSVSTIRGLETGKRPNPRMTTVRQLADALALDPEDREELLGAAVAGRQGGTVAGERGGAGAGERGGTAAGERGGAVAGRGVAESPVRGAPAGRDALAEAAEQLAKAVATRWRREEEHRQVQDPYPLPVRWRPAAARDTDHWANIRRLPPGAPNEPLDLSGRLERIAEIYRSVPSGRLVVLGRSGSGKSILTLRFVLDHLASRTDAEPVPVIFSIGAWDPTGATLRDWLTEQLVRDHPGTSARGAGGVVLASALVDAGHVLPVLDGFDEMAAGLRRPALEALNATTLPLLLTSRPDEYSTAVGQTDVLTSAAAIELTDLTLDDLAHYLPRTTRRPDPADPDGGAWDPVMRSLREQPAEASGSPLATVLRTPLMVALARTVYSDTPGRTPADLLDATRFANPRALENHLLDNFLPAVYRNRPRNGPYDGDPDRAARWLGHLAQHLTRLETPDLAWWHLGNGTGRATRTLVTAVVTALAIGLVDVLVILLGGHLAGAFVDAAVVGPAAGVMFGLVHWFTYTVMGKDVAPSAVRLQFRRRSGATVWSAGPRMVIGALGGAFFGFAYGFLAGLVRGYAMHAPLSAGLRIGCVDGLIDGLVFGVGAGAVFCLLGVLETPLDIAFAVGPRSVLITNRRTVRTQLLVWAPTFGLVVGFGSEVAVALLQGHLGQLVWTTSNAVVLGTISGLGGALGYSLALTAWGQWFCLSRLWLPLTGRLPWSVVTFLEDAYQRGVLRQAGAVYQFRHSRLQHRLALAHLSGSELHGDVIDPG